MSDEIKQAYREGFIDGLKSSCINAENLKDIETIANHYDKEGQLIVAVEECAELIKAITKILRGQPNIENLVEETADVMIMCQQICDYVGAELVSEAIDFKLKRQISRIERKKK